MSAHDDDDDDDDLAIDELLRIGSHREKRDLARTLKHETFFFFFFCFPLFPLLSFY